MNELLKLFWDNTDIREAVREALFDGLEDYKLSSVAELSNEQIGAEARAHLKARDILYRRFNSISQFGTQDSKTVENPAR